MEIDREGITDDHLVAIAQCVLAWGKCESNLRALLSALEGKSLDAGARSYNRLPPEDAWKRIKRTLRSQGATEGFLEAVQNNRDASRAFYETRKHLVHAGCVGTWSRDNKFMCFSAFENYGENELVLYWVPLDEVSRSTTFATSTTELALKILASLGH